jgi:AcrR family transcriptional regulator
MPSARSRNAPRIRKSGALRRQEIADASLRVIAERGLGHFTAAEVAREVGLTDGALFRHFATMDDVVLAAIDRVEELLFEGFPPKHRDPLERLGAFFRKRVESVALHPGVSRLIHGEELTRAAPPAGVERVASFRARSAGFVRSCLAEAQRQGILAPELGVAEAQVLVMGAVMALARGPAPAPRGVGQLAGRVWAALESFLRGGRPARARRPPP